MPKTKRELYENSLLDDDSSDEDESDDESDDESGSGSGSGSDDESGSGSDSDSDDDDDESGSGSDDDSSDDSSSDKKKKKKKKKGKDDEKKDEEDDVNTIYKIQQISSKLSWLLDDLHKTFKPKSVPKINPKDVFPYPYTSLPQQSPESKKYYKYNHQYINDLQNENKNEQDQDPKVHFSTHNKSPISSPIRHGNEVDRGVGGHYIFPSYAAPPSKNGKYFSLFILYIL